MISKPIGVLYEHPEWFRPLFAELERRGLPHEGILAHEHRYDPSATEAPYSLVVNRVSPSAYLRGHGQAIFVARHYLAHLERLGVATINGSAASPRSSESGSGGSGPPRRHGWRASGPIPRRHAAPPPRGSARSPPSG